MATIHYEVTEYPKLDWAESQVDRYHPPDGAQSPDDPCCDWFRDEILATAHLWLSIFRKEGVVLARVLGPADIPFNYCPNCGAQVHLVLGRTLQSDLEPMSGTVFEMVTRSESGEEIRRNLWGTVADVARHEDDRRRELERTAEHTGAGS